METSTLNLAHEKQRRAEALLREGKFEEAAKCHELIADLLERAHEQLKKNYVDFRTSSFSSQELSSRHSSRHSVHTLESLALQRDFHRRQSDVVRMKQAQYEEYKASLENQDYKRNLSARSIFSELFPEKMDGSLKKAIYKTIDEQDTLLSLISLPDDNNAFKHPKDTLTVIEELRTVNCQLRSLIGSLLCQLEAKDEEIQHLKEQMNSISVNSNTQILEDPLETSRLPPLPPLAPLEMPEFDFNKMQ